LSATWWPVFIVGETKNRLLTLNHRRIESTATGEFGAGNLQRGQSLAVPTTIRESATRILISYRDILIVVSNRSTHWLRQLVAPMMTHLGPRMGSR
jgi:hypothetical protein